MFYISQYEIQYRFQVFMIYEILFQKVESQCCRFIHFSKWVLAPWDMVPTAYTDRALHQAGPDCERNMRFFMTHLQRGEVNCYLLGLEGCLQTFCWDSCLLSLAWLTVGFMCLENIVLIATHCSLSTVPLMTKSNENNHLNVSWC